MNVGESCFVAIETFRVFDRLLSAKLPVYEVKLTRLSSRFLTVDSLPLRTTSHPIPIFHTALISPIPYSFMNDLSQSLSNPTPMNQLEGHLWLNTLSSVRRFETTDLNPVRGWRQK